MTDEPEMSILSGQQVIRDQPEMSTETARALAMAFAEAAAEDEDDEEVQGAASGARWGSPEDKRHVEAMRRESRNQEPVVSRGEPKVPVKAPSHRETHFLG